MVKVNPNQPRRKYATRSRTRTKTPQPRMPSRDEEEGSAEEGDLLIDFEESDDDFMNGGDSSGASDVDDIMDAFDSDGMPIQIPDDHHGVIKLPPEFKNVARKRRFRKPYSSPSYRETNFFDKNEGMTKLFGQLDQKLQQAVEDYVKVKADAEPLEQNAGKVGVMELIRAEMLNWYLCKLNKIPSSHEHEIWKQTKFSLKSIYVRHVAELSGIFPESELRARTFLAQAFQVGDTLELKLESAHLQALSVKHTLRHLGNELDEKIAAKNTLIDFLQLYRNTLQERPPEFDETSIRGLKPLRTSFNPPYFKDWHGRIAAPSLFSRTEITSLIVLLTSMKQKWTLKDARELRMSILNSVLEKKLSVTKELADSVDAQFILAAQTDRDAKIVSEVNIGEAREGAGIGEPGFRRGRGRGGRGGYFGRLRAQKKRSTDSPTPGCEAVPQTLMACANSVQVRDWFRKESERIRRMKYEQIFDEQETFTVKDVDWNDVSAKLMNLTKKLRMAEDCRSCFLHAANPVYDNRRRWGEAEKAILKKHAEKREEWDQISHCYTKRRPEFIIFYKWRKVFDAPKKVLWGKEKEARLRAGIQHYGANWNKIPVELGDFGATKKQVQERFKKSLNPMLRFGKFTRVEDSLMLLTMEKLKGQFRREKHFGIMTAYLPWRYESAWRDRAENLFAEYIVPWTLEEDKKLIRLAGTMKRDWSKIAKEFNSFKTRKGCLTRFKILEKRLCRFDSLEHYHDAYAMIRYNVMEYQHLKDISALLKKILKEQVQSFTGLARDRTPTEEELQKFILSFDRDVMASTIQMIDIYIMKRDEYWSDWRKKNGVQPGEKKKTHDRRTFHPENTQSIASALHIRDVKLIPQETLKFELTPRESEIYRYYARFCSTKPLKKDKPRPYIPHAEVLVVLDDVKRIVLSDAGGDGTPEGPAGRKREGAAAEVVPKKRKYQRRSR